jgi:hypothetical protein
MSNETRRAYAGLRAAALGPLLVPDRRRAVLDPAPRVEPALLTTPAQVGALERRAPLPGYLDEA